MAFNNPEYLWFFIPFFCLLLFLLKKRAKKKKERYIEVSSEEFYRLLPKWKRFVVRVPFITIALGVAFVCLALAGPMGDYQINPLKVYAKEINFSIDLSTSMKGKAILTIKEELWNFIKRRKYDYMALTAYGGSCSGNVKCGKAAVVVFPTNDLDALKHGIEKLNPGMLGMYTSIGEGVFLTLMMHIKKYVKELPGFSRAEFYRLLVYKETWPMALNMVQGIGPFKNKVINIFTDGKYNTGIDPSGPLWICSKLGIRVHFVSVKSSSATGLSLEEQKVAKETLRRYVLATGGGYFEATSLEDIVLLYEEVDRLEADMVILGPKINRVDLSLYFVGVAIFFTLVAIVSFLAMPDYS